MTRRKKTKSILEQTRKDATSLLGIGVTASVGTTVLAGIPGSAEAQRGVATFSGIALPAGGAILGGRAAIGLASSLQSKKKRRRKR